MQKSDMKVEIAMIEEHTDELKFASRVASKMEDMETENVHYAVTKGENGYLYSAMIIKKNDD